MTFMCYNGNFYLKGSIIIGFIDIPRQNRLILLLGIASLLTDCLSCNIFWPWLQQEITSEYMSIPQYGQAQRPLISILGKYVNVKNVSVS